MTSHSEIPILKWHGCYQASWKGMITKKAFKHPAKFARGLVDRILDHCFERGYLREGDLVGDPFGGIATGGIMCAYRRLQWIGNELEPEFVTMADENFVLHRTKWETLKAPAPIIHRGDSRRFDQIVDLILSSPPFQKQVVGGGMVNIDWSKSKHGSRRATPAREAIGQPYGKTPGQIGNLADGSIDTVVSSPPFADSMRGQKSGIDDSKTVRPGGPMGNSLQETGFGKSDGQIGGLRPGEIDAVVASPPFAGTSGQGGGGINVNGYKPAPGRKFKAPCGNPDMVGARTYQGRGAKRTNGNIETLKEGTVDACIGSPPYSETLAHGGGPDTKQDILQGGKSLLGIKEGYGNTEGNIGNCKHGDVKLVVTSPPYADIAAGAGGLNTKPAKKPGQQSGRNPASASQSGNWSKDLLRYGKEEGQISRLQGGSVDGVVTSPPWENNAEGGRKGSKLRNPLATKNRGKGASDKAVLAQAARDEEKVYGDSPGQIGKQKGETYWEAVNEVYRACFRCLRPGGYMILVVKDYCKDKKRVRLCDDTMKLLSHIGFVPIERVHAMLVSETTEHGLFEQIKVKKQRKSFFRRTYEQTIPEGDERRIDYEEVLICQKPI